MQTKDYLNKGYEEIIMISSDFVEDKNGFNDEYHTVQIACLYEGKYYEVELSYCKKYGPSAVPGSLNEDNKKEISKKEHEDYKQEYGILDTPEFKKELADELELEQRLKRLDSFLS